MIDKRNNEKYYKRTFAKKCTYKGYEFDSQMEMHFAMFLDGQMFNYKGTNYYHKPIRWERESREFELISQEDWVDKTERDTRVKTIIRNKKHILQRVVYTPDFYLPDYDLYIELKGFQFEDALYHLRLRFFKHFYPETAIAIIRHHNEFFNIDNIIKNRMIEFMNKENN